MPSRNHNANERSRVGQPGGSAKHPETRGRKPQGSSETFRKPAHSGAALSGVWSGLNRETEKSSDPDWLAFESISQPEDCVLPWSLSFALCSGRPRKGKTTTMNRKSLAALAFALLFAFVPLLGTEKSAQAEITRAEAEERLDIAIGLFRMAVAAEGKLINWYQVDQDDPKAEAIATDYCGNLDLLMETSRNLGEVVNPKNKALLSDPHISDKVRQLMRLEKTFTSDSTQLMGMGFSCPSNSNPDPSSVDPNSMTKSPV